jgi:hypothetical protein
LSPQGLLRPLLLSPLLLLLLLLLLLPPPPPRQYLYFCTSKITSKERSLSTC